VRLGLATAVAIGAALGACRPATTRPPFPPVPQAATTEVRLSARDAARFLAEALQGASIPTRRLELRDTWFQTGWFDATSGKDVKHRPIGPSVVLVRGWADPTHPGNSKLTVETIYRPVADPSLPDRDLDRQVPRDHPVAIKVRAALQDLVKRFGGPPAPVEPKAAAPSEETPEPEEAPEPEPADTVP
jgi:hypothetical protein